MPTNTAGHAGQDYSDHRRQVQYLNKRVVYSEWTGTNNDAHTAFVLPPRAVVLYGATWIETAFNDTSGDDLDIGVSGSDDDLFASAVDLNTGTVLTTFDDLADANRYSASARTVTYNFTTAPTGDGTTGVAHIYLEYFVPPAS